VAVGTFELTLNLNTESESESESESVSEALELGGLMPGLKFAAAPHFL